MVHLLKDKIVIEIETDDPAGEYTVIKEALRHLIIVSIEQQSMLPQAINVIYLLNEMAITTEQAKKIIEPTSQINESK